MRAIGYPCRLGAHALVICDQHQAFITITEYIRQRRLSHAEMLLAVGYRSDGRFAALPKENCGLYPAEYRQMARSSGECRK